MSKENKFVGKLNIQSVAVVVAKDEELAKKQFLDGMKLLVDKLQKEYPGIKFTADTFVLMTELPEEN